MVVVKEGSVDTVHNSRVQAVARSPGTEAVTLHPLRETE